MNEYDSNRIFDFAKKIGYEKTNEVEKTNCYIINTCHIREKATDKVFHDIGRLKKKFKDKKKPILIIAGCVAQAEGEVILKKEKYVDAVVGPQSYHEICNIIDGIEKKNLRKEFTEFEVIEKFDKLSFIKNTSQKISSFLTIQEGCDKFCKFCVVPYTRGPEHSRPFDSIIIEAKQLISNGVKEITLLGQNVNAYEYKKKRLSDLIEKLENFDELKRIRYTTSHPKDVTSDLIEIHGNSKKLMPLLHLPVQSGSSKVLKSMNRKHDVGYYLEIIQKLKSKNKLIKFSSDFIIAYPGEKDKDFNETVNLMKKIKFINSYSFTFSPRPGTPAAEMILINPNVAKKRLAEFQKISNEIKINYRKNLVNTKVKVLFENKLKNEKKYFGRDEHYNSVVVSSDIDLIGKIADIKIETFNHNTLFGKFYSNNKNYAAA
jgi:tRNA-2-methylthio-N6-dimethylallyladenosine synthase